MDSPTSLNLRALRERHDLTLERAGRVLGLPPALLARWERDGRPLPSQYLADFDALAAGRVLQVAVDAAHPQCAVMRAKAAALPPGSPRPAVEAYFREFLAHAPTCPACAAHLAALRAHGDARLPRVGWRLRDWLRHWRFRWAGV